MLPDIQPGNTKILYFFNCLLDGMHTKRLEFCDFVLWNFDYNLANSFLSKVVLLGKMECLAQRNKIKPLIIFSFSDTFQQSDFKSFLFSGVYFPSKLANKHRISEGEESISFFYRFLIRCHNMILSC